MPPMTSIHSVSRSIAFTAAKAGYLRQQLHKGFAVDQLKQDDVTSHSTHDISPLSLRDMKLQKVWVHILTS